MTKVVLALSAAALATSVTAAGACEWGKSMSKVEDQVTMSSPYIVPGTVETITAGETFEPAPLVVIESAVIEPGIVIMPTETVE